VSNLGFKTTAVPAKSALLIVDVQQAFVEGEYEAFQIARVIERINAMADKARRANAPVVFCSISPQRDCFGAAPAGGNSRLGS
jgi:nicotinamidase-related amidase